MKINEILTKEELEKIENWYGIINVEQTAMQLEKHVLEMEVKDFILYQIWTELETMRYTINEIKEYM